MPEQPYYEINVLIAGRKYPLVVSQEEESTVREVVRSINQDIDDMHSRYASRLSKQDIMAMLLLTNGKKLIEMQQQAVNLEQQRQRLELLDDLLDESLGK